MGQAEAEPEDELQPRFDPCHAHETQSQGKKEWVLNKAKHLSM